jgi:hypothetical protein
MDDLWVCYLGPIWNLGRKEVNAGGLWIDASRSGVERWNVFSILRFSVPCLLVSPMFLISLTETITAVQIESQELHVLGRVFVRASERGGLGSQLPETKRGSLCWCHKHRFFVFL